MNVIIKNGFVIDPYYELLPDYKICPFSNRDLVFNRTLSGSCRVDRSLTQRFGDSPYYYANSGRQALRWALAAYGLNKEDCVTILTTSGNFYISSCVTREVEQVCTWSRQFEPTTKLILVNHEFGYPFKDWERVRSYPFPVIEDCAHSFFTEDEHIGKVGDYVIYSFPKIFPVQYGGLLVVNRQKRELRSPINPAPGNDYLKSVLSYYIEKKDEIIDHRRQNHYYLSDRIKEVGGRQRFSLEEGVVPGVFLFRIDQSEDYLAGMKKYLYAHGIQCSVFYGESAFYIPVHQNLTKADMDYFVTVIESYMVKPG